MSRMRPLPGSAVRKSLRRVSGELGDLARHLHARRPGADHHERQVLAAPSGIALELGGLEGGEDAAADEQGALERLHLGGMGAPLVVAEVGVVRAARDDQRVIGDRLRCRQAGDRSEDHLAPLEIEALDLGEQYAHVAVALEDGPQRIRDLARRQRAGRHLVGQRLEQVEVAPVDERDLHGCGPQPACRLESAEAAADDDDPVVAHDTTSATCRGAAISPWSAFSAAR